MPHPDYAYAFINFVMRPANMAAITNSTGYPTASAKARPMVDATMTANPDIYRTRPATSGSFRVRI
jgi:putrescine transport system substrate-binding protein